jgi:hypothetical protein
MGYLLINIPHVMNADTYFCCYACKDPTKSYLATYNCEPTTHPKPHWAWRARKQIYRPDFVLNHFVHYSLVTRRILDNPEDELLVCDIIGFVSQTFGYYVKQLSS